MADYAPDLANLPRIPARTPDGDAHHVHYDGPAHLIPLGDTFANLPALPDGEEWVLLHHKIVP